MTEKKLKEILEFPKYFFNMSPKDLNEVLESLEDGDYLSEKGKKFRKLFWELFIKEI